MRRHLLRRAAGMCSACFATLVGAQELSHGDPTAAIATMPAALARPAEVFNGSDGADGSRRMAGWVLFSTSPVPLLGSTVALIDTGVRATHRDLIGRVVGGINVINGSADTSDVVGHGSITGSIVVGRIDPNGLGRNPLILPIRVFDTSVTTEANVNAGLAYSLARATIVNMSLAASGPISEAAIRTAVAAGQLLVVAAGNSGLASPEWPARYAGATWSNSQIIAVGAVGASNTIAGFSNRAGDAQNAFLVAPGVNIVGASNASDTGLVSASGTSVAAPYVSGLAALVKAYWPQLSAPQIANILLTTAIDLGEPGTDAVYGRGLVSQDRALAPVGPTMIPTAAGTSVPVSGAAMNPGPVAGAALRAAAADGRLMGVGLDSFGRQFYYNFGAGITPTLSFDLQRLLGAVDRNVAFAERVLAGGGRLLYGLDQNVPLPGNGLAAYERRDQARSALAGAALTLPLGGDRDIGLGTLGLASTYFGLAGAGDRWAAVAAQPALANPLFSFARGHHHLGLSQGLSAGFRFKTGVVTTAQTEPLLGQYGLIERPLPRNRVVLAELSRRIGDGLVAVSATQFREESGYFGSVSESAYRLGERPATNAFTIQAAYRITSSLIVAGQYTLARTPAFRNASPSLITGATASGANAMAIGLVKADTWRAYDRLSLTLSQPLRASGGALDFDLPVDVDAAGNVIRSQTRIGLQPSGRERTTELAYTRPLGRTGNVGVVLLHRYQPNHVATAPSERAMAARWAWVF